MKKVKSLLLVAVLSFVLFTTNVFAKDKVKVYVFEAGGCPYCEAQIEYLKKLDSYKEKFEIVQKELYVDHVDWEQGKDYELGVKVAEAFQGKGYQNASYQGTPFVVISNIYAAASYSESLESVINQAYEAGDEDVVGCFEDDKSNCEDKIEQNENTTTSTEQPTTGTDDTNTEKEKNDNSTTAVIILVLIVGVGAALIVIARGKAKEESEEIKPAAKPDARNEAEQVIDEEVKKASTKKAPTKKAPTKKTTTKKVTKKTTKKTTKK